MVLFFAPEINGTIHALDEQESRHCVKVMRLGQGDEVSLTDGMGNIFSAQITKASPRQVELRITDKKANVGKRPYQLHVAIAPTKNPDRLEWFVEKAIEIGIDEITPLICSRSERKEINVDRLMKVAISAIKQSFQAYLPVVNGPELFLSFIEKVHEGSRFIGYCGDADKVTLLQAGCSSVLTTMLVGPEGDFTETEISSAIQQGYRPVTLGQNRMRVETAGIAAVAQIGLLCSQKLF